MLWIGLTGAIGSGKSTIGSYLKTKGWDVIDADQLARDAVAPKSVGLMSVVQSFGSGVLNEDGTLNRGLLAKIVFASPEARALLETIVHPLVREKAQYLRGALEAQGVSLAFYEVPLLFEKSMESQFDKIIVVFCSEAEQKRRLKARSVLATAATLETNSASTGSVAGLTDDEIDQRLQAQWSQTEKLKRAHYVVDNSGDLENSKRQVDAIISQLERLVV